LRFAENSSLSLRLLHAAASTRIGHVGFELALYLAPDLRG
jgi:hypothetical protein